MISEHYSPAISHLWAIKYFEDKNPWGVIVFKSQHTISPIHLFDFLQLLSYISYLSHFCPLSRGICLPDGWGYSTLSWKGQLKGNSCLCCWARHCTRPGFSFPLFNPFLFVSCLFPSVACICFWSMFTYAHFSSFYRRFFWLLVKAFVQRVSLNCIFVDFCVGIVEILFDRVCFGNSSFFYMLGWPNYVLLVWIRISLPLFLHLLWWSVQLGEGECFLPFILLCFVCLAIKWMADSSTNGDYRRDELRTCRSWNIGNLV